jgi:F0F1-type ATP synthase membrane subunit b/b'
MRRAALQEAASERTRIEGAAESEASKILSIAEMEIEASVKAARQELKRYAAQLAVGVAESQIRASLTPQTEQRILRSFVQELGSPKPAAGDGVAAVDSRTDSGSPTRN